MEQDISFLNILVYGAHLVALECYRELCQNGFKERISGFVVSDLKDNPVNLEGKTVRNIKDYAEHSSEYVVMIAMPKKYHDIVECEARKMGFRFFRRFDLEKMSIIKGERLIRNYVDSLPFDLRKSMNDPTWLDAYAVKSEKSVRCKYPTLFYLDDELMIQQSYELYDRFECELEGIRERSSHLHSLKANDCSKIIQIYMVFGEGQIDFVKNSSFDPWIKPLQISGYSAVSRYGDNFDDGYIGNLSDKNRFLAEMTGAHWIWKQAKKSDYKGLCHYRRHFVLSPESISAMKDDGIDVLLSTPRFVPNGIKRMFTAETPVKEPVITNILDSLEVQAKNDKTGFEKYLENRFYFPNNMVVAKSEIYDEYCQWIFPVLFRIMKIDQETEYGHEYDRHIAYAAELLTSYYFIKRKNELKITYTDYKFYE